MEIILIVNKIVESKPKWWTKDNRGLQFIHNRVLQWENTNRTKFKPGKCGHWVYLIFTVFILLQLHEWFGKRITVPPTTENGIAVSFDLYSRKRDNKAISVSLHAIILSMYDLTRKENKQLTLNARPSWATAVLHLELRSTNCSVVRYVVHKNASRGVNEQACNRQVGGDVKKQGTRYYTKNKRRGAFWRENNKSRRQLPHPPE